MKLKQLELFARLVEAGSFTRAARGLGMTKSTASRELKQLETEVGVRLLHRTTRSLKVSDSGRIYYDRIKVALGWLEHAGNAVSQQGQEPRGPVRVTAPPHLAMHLISALAKFMRKHPKIRVELSFSSSVVDMVQEGFDIAVRVGRMRDSSLIARRVGNETLDYLPVTTICDVEGSPGPQPSLRSTTWYCSAVRAEAMYGAILSASAVALASKV